MMMYDNRNNINTYLHIMNTYSIFYSTKPINHVLHKFKYKSPSLSPSYTYIKCSI